MKKQYVFVPKWFWLVAALVMLANLVVPVMAVSNALDSDEAEVVVEVYINNYDEEYIKNWTFDDGTKVCDYNYVITYQPVPRSPPAPFQPAAPMPVLPPEPPPPGPGRFPPSAAQPPAKAPPGR